MNEPVLNYRIEGSGPPLLLIHGFGISFNIWKSILPHLRPHFTLIMIQLPGIGSSPMPLEDRPYMTSAVDGIERVRLALGYESLDILGYSTGSRVAEAYVRIHSARVRHAIFLCPVFLDALKTSALRLGFFLDDLSPSIGSWFLRGWRLKFLISLYGFSLHPDPLRDEWYAEIRALPADILKATLYFSLLLGRQPFRVSVPAACVWGDQDIVSWTPRRLRWDDFVVRSSHAAPVLAADEVAEVILRILR